MKSEPLGRRLFVVPRFSLVFYHDFSRFVFSVKVISTPSNASHTLSASPLARKMETPMVGQRLGAVHEDIGLAVKRRSLVGRGVY